MTAQQTWTVNAIQSAMRARGSHWWDPDTMRSFGTRVLPTVYHGPGGIYFVTSEKPPHGPRAYSVRQFFPESADLDTVGEFCSLGKAYAVRQAKQLAETPLQSQWLRAFRALDEATTGKDLGKTFDASRNYQSIADAQAGQVIYFAGHGGYTRAVAREYHDSSGIYLELVEAATPAEATHKAFRDAYKLQSEVCRVLKTYATDAYARESAEAAEDYKPVSVLDQFLHDLDAHSSDRSKVTTRDAKHLMTSAKRHHHLMELLCSDEAFNRGVDSEGNHQQITDCRAKIRQVAKRLGAAGVVFSGDPRGCTVKLTFADGHTNDWAKEGYCVPTGENE